MNFYVDSPYNTMSSKTASKPIVLPESVNKKILEVLPKIEKAQKFLRKNPKRISTSPQVFEIAPEEDIYLNEGWEIKFIVTKKPPVGASLDYREQEKTLYISTNWQPNFKGIYHELVHAMDPKARPGSEGYIQRDPDTYFQEEPGGYYKVPEEIDAIQSSMINRIIEFSKTLNNKQKQKYISDIVAWLKSPDKAKIPPVFYTWGASEWLAEPKLRKQFLKRVYWALEEVKEPEEAEIEVEEVEE